MSADRDEIFSSVPSVLQPLLPEVCIALRELLSTTGEALGRGDLEGARLAAHALKGASMHFGLTTLSLAAAEIEQDVEEEGGGSESEAVRAGLTRFASLLAALEAVL
jgi:HPt (histidine-containing phosphotransfer) domain-containing protein